MCMLNNGLECDKWVLNELVQIIRGIFLSIHYCPDTELVGHLYARRSTTLHRLAVCGNTKNPLSKIIIVSIVQYFFAKFLEIIPDTNRRYYCKFYHLNFRCSVLNIKYDLFSTVQTNKSDYSQISGVFWTFTRLKCRRKHHYLSLKPTY